MWLVKDKIFYVDNFLSEYELEELDKLISDHQESVKLLSDYGILYHLGGYKTVTVDNPTVESIHNRIFKLLLQLSTEPFEFHPRNELQFLFPTSNQSVHVDGGDDAENILFGIVVYLSDPDSYEGGEIFYPDYDISLKPSRGSLAMHAGGVAHGVTRIDKGMRYVLVAFVGIPT